MEAVIFTADPAVPGVISSESPLPAWGWSLIFVLAVLLIQYLGVQLSTRVQLTLALVSIIAVTVFLDQGDHRCADEQPARVQPDRGVGRMDGDPVRGDVRGA